MPIYKTGKKKDGIQQYRVIVNYTDKNGKYCDISRLVYGKAEATLMEMRLNAEKGKKNSPQTHTFTLNTLLNDYIETKKYEIRDSSLEKSISILKNHVLPIFAETKLSTFDAQILQQWKNSINEKGLSLTMRNNIYAAFNALFNYATKMDYIEKNPLKQLGKFKDALDFSKPQDKLHYYTAEQFKEFITYAKSQCTDFNQWKYYVFFNIAFFTGMRKGEINALKWSDIDGNIIHVRRSLNLKKKGVPFVETPPKTKKSYRDLQMPKQLIEILEEHKKRQESSVAFTNDFRVCGGYKHLSDTGISNYNIKCASACNLPHIRVNDYRHTHASLLINERINIKEISRRLGHSRVEQTWNRYGHLYPREEEIAVKILGDLKF